MALEPDQVDDSHTPPSIVSDSAVEQNVEVTNSGLRKRRSSPSLSGGGGQTGKHYWGGSLIETAKEHDGLVSKIGSDFAAETTCHGINQIFNRESGWLRSIFYAFALVMIGWFFVWLVMPTIQDYKYRKVNTHVETHVQTGGTPLPTVTVCSSGSGVKCDCLLWLKLHCRYRYEIRNYDWMSRFDKFACWTNFDLKNTSLGGHPMWKDPDCSAEALSREDVCGRTSPGNITVKWGRESLRLEETSADDLFEAIISRENYTDGPYMTRKEVTEYASLDLKSKLFFGLPTDSDEIVAEPVPKSWIDYIYPEQDQFRLCTRVWPPPNTMPRQLFPGHKHGILVLAFGITTAAYPLMDMAHSTSSVKMYVTTMLDSQRENAENFLAAPNEFFEVPTGQVSYIEHTITLSSRQRGWGSEASRTCTDSNVPRNFCSQNYILDKAASECRCGANISVIDPRSQHFLDCSAISNAEYECVESALSYANRQRVPLSICPYQCNEYHTEITQNYRIPISEGQVAYVEYLADRHFQWGETFNVYPSQTVMAFVGMDWLHITAYTESPSTSFGALMGQIGGNLGLWCGMSFITLVEFFEFAFIVTVYGKYFRR